MSGITCVQPDQQKNVLGMICVQLVQYHNVLGITFVQPDQQKNVLGMVCVQLDQLSP